MSGQIERFLNNADASGLLTAEEITELIESLPSDRRPQDSEQLARELVRQNKLTKYQAEQIHAGKTKLLVLGNYVVLDKLGQGGMGIVLKAEHRRLKRLVALKVMSPSVVKTPDALRRFLREVEAAAKLRHPNVVATDDANEARGIHFLVMEYVEGSDLSILIKKNGPMSVQEALPCILQAAKGLEYAHAQGVVHRDIKPANLLLDSKKRIKILDMGLARIEGATDGQAELTSTGAVMGTVDYMAPEQAISTRRADARSDIYSLGVSLWYLLTGKCVYNGDSLMAKLLAHRDAPIPSLHEFNNAIPRSVDDVFRRMVAKQPADRYQSMSEVIRDLEACLPGSSSPLGVSMPATPKNAVLDSFLSQLANTPTQPIPPGKAKLETPPETVNPAAEATVLNPNPEISALTVTLQNSGVISEKPTSPRSTEVTPRTVAASAAKSPAVTTIHTAKSRPWFRHPSALGAISIAILIGVAGIIFLQPAAPGTIRTEIVDSMVELTLKGTSSRFSSSETQPLTLPPGEKSFVVKRGGLQFEITKVPVTSDVETVLRVETIDNYLTIKANGAIVAEKLLPTDSTASKVSNVADPSAMSSGPAAPAVGRFGLRILPESYVEIPSLRREKSGPMTIEMWVQAPRPRGVLFSMEGKPGVQFSCERGPNGAAFFDVLERKRGGNTLLHLPLEWPNRKRHLAMVWDADKSVFFVDGKAVANGEVIPDADAAEIPPGNTSVTMIGSQLYGDKKGYHCSGGTFYGLRVSSIVRYQQDFVPPESFTADDRTVALYAFDEGKGPILTDSSGNNHHGTIVGAKWVAADEALLTKEASEVKPGDPSVMDLLSLIDPATDTWRGKCRKDGDALLLEQAKVPTRVQIKHKVPAEYLLVADVERLAGTDGIQFGLVIGGNPVSFVIDSFPSCITGLGLVTGRPADNNFTTSLGRRLVNGQRHIIAFHVKQDSVLASFDGQHLLEWNGDPVDLMLPNYEVPHNGSQLWIGSATVPVKFHSFRMKSLREAVDLPLLKEPPWPYDPPDGVEYAWSEPENAGPAINSRFFDEHPEVSADGLSLWLSSGGELWTCQRNSVQEPFGPRVNAGTIINDGGAWDSDPSLTADGLQLFFSSDRASQQKDLNLWTCSRKSLNDPWSPPVKLNSEVNSYVWDWCPAISADGRSLFFSSHRAGRAALCDIWMASRPDNASEFTNVTMLGPEINTGPSAQDPYLSSDGLTMLLSSQHRGGRGQNDIYIATRPAIDAPFGPATPIGGPINTINDENGPCLAESGKVLYFYSNRPGGLGRADIWFSRRVPKNIR